MKPLPCGLVGERTFTVRRPHTVPWAGNIPILSTPTLVWFMEETAGEVSDLALDEDEACVGSTVNLTHRAATPMGMKVTVRAELVEVDRRRLRFAIEARDEAELIGEATHDRYVIQVAKFAAAVAKKAAASGAKL